MPGPVGDILNAQEHLICYSGGFLFYDKWVALVLKAKPMWQMGKLNCIGGAIEPLESPRTAMQREFKEETGLETMESDWSEKLIITGKGWRVHFFAGKWHEKAELKGLPTEPVGWYLYDPLPKHVIHNLRWIVPFMMDPDIIKPLSVYDARGMEYGTNVQAGDVLQAKV